jgi:hypothetical protein
MSGRFRARIKSSHSAARWALWSTIAVVAACGSAATESASISQEKKGGGDEDSGGGGGWPARGPDDGTGNASTGNGSTSNGSTGGGSTGNGSGAGGGGDPGTNPFDGPAQCTSNTFSNVDEGSAMKPGMACVSCHDSSGDAPDLTLGGTVYATPHEPDDCNAQVEMGPPINTAVVEITDKNGAVIQLSVNSVGSFYRKSSKGPVAMPYTAKIKYNGAERAMASAQTSGDCNKCHTQSGSQGAPGRVLLP